MDYLSLLLAPIPVMVVILLLFDAFMSIIGVVIDWIREALAD